MSRDNIIADELFTLLRELSEAHKESAEQYERECEEYWNALSYEEKLKAFYSVISRVVKGELEDKGSYRHVLYEVFGFGPDAYIVGMDCGFLRLHNSINETS